MGVRGPGTWPRADPARRGGGACARAPRRAGRASGGAPRRVRRAAARRAMSGGGAPAGVLTQIERIIDAALQDARSVAVCPAPACAPAATRLRLTACLGVRVCARRGGVGCRTHVALHPPAAGYHAQEATNAGPWGCSRSARSCPPGVLSAALRAAVARRCCQRCCAAAGCDDEV